MWFLKTTFQVERSIDIKASKQDVWEYITQMEKKNIWSPWIIIEPNCETTQEGTPWKVWSKESWKGEVVWEGNQIVKESKKNNFIECELNFTKPFKSTNISSFSLKESKWITTITWKMTANLPIFLFFLKKQMSFFIGEDFKRGLHMLKTLVETGKLETATDFDGELEMEETYYLSLSGKGTLSEIIPQMWADFEKLGHLLALGWERQFFTIYPKADLMKDKFEYTACCSISHAEYTDYLVDDNYDFYPGILTPAKYHQTTHLGAYEFLSNSWAGAIMYARAKGIKIDLKQPAIELYEVGMMHGGEEENFKTHILIPKK